MVRLFHAERLIKMQELTSIPQVLMLDWDFDGEKLAILQEGNSAIIVWDSATRYNFAIMVRVFARTYWLDCSN